jgi:hypothetical protein
MSRAIVIAVVSIAFGIAVAVTVSVLPGDKGEKAETYIAELKSEVLDAAFRGEQPLALTRQLVRDANSLGYIVYFDSEQFAIDLEIAGCSPCAAIVAANSN